MSDPTPRPQSRLHSRRVWPVAAAVLCGVHAVVLAGLASFYGLELGRGEGSNRTTVAMSGVLILVFAALLVVLARAWWAGSTRAAVPTLVWNGVLVPVVFGLYSAGQVLLGTGLLVLVVAGVVTTVAALSTSATP